MNIFDALIVKRPKHIVIQKHIWCLAVTLPSPHLRIAGDLENANHFAILDDGRQVILVFCRHMWTCIQVKKKPSFTGIWGSLPQIDSNYMLPCLYFYLHTKGIGCIPRYAGLVEQYGLNMVASCEWLHRTQYVQFWKKRSQSDVPEPAKSALDESPWNELFIGIASHYGLCDFYPGNLRKEEPKFVLKDEQVDLMRFASQLKLEELWKDATSPATSVDHLIRQFVTKDARPTDFFFDTPRATMRNPYLYVY